MEDETDLSSSFDSTGQCSLAGHPPTSQQPLCDLLADKESFVLEGDEPYECGSMTCDENNQTHSSLLQPLPIETVLHVLEFCPSYGPFTCTCKYLYTILQLKWVNLVDEQLDPLISAELTNEVWTTKVVLDVTVPVEDIFSSVPERATYCLQTLTDLTIRIPRTVATEIRPRYLCDLFGFLQRYWIEPSCKTLTKFRLIVDSMWLDEHLTAEHLEHMVSTMSTQLEVLSLAISVPAVKALKRFRKLSDVALVCRCEAEPITEGLIGSSTKLTHLTVMYPARGGSEAPLLCTVKTLGAQYLHLRQLHLLSLGAVLNTIPLFESLCNLQQLRALSLHGISHNLLEGFNLIVSRPTHLEDIEIISETGEHEAGNNTMCDIILRAPYISKLERLHLNVAVDCDPITPPFRVPPFIFVCPDGPIDSLKIVSLDGTFGYLCGLEAPNLEVLNVSVYHGTFSVDYLSSKFPLLQNLTIVHHLHAFGGIIDPPRRPTQSFQNNLWKFVIAFPFAINPKSIPLLAMCIYSMPNLRELALMFATFSPPTSTQVAILLKAVFVLKKLEKLDFLSKSLLQGNNEYAQMSRALCTELVKRGVRVAVSKAAPAPVTAAPPKKKKNCIIM